MPKLRMKRHAVTQPLDQPYRLIPLTRNQNAIVDKEDFDWLNQWNWYACWNVFTNSFYAVRREGKKVIHMTKQILGCKLKEMPDHKNHITLDNQRKNLRKCTKLQNNYNRRKPKSNTSGYIGVSYREDMKRWIARIGDIYLGTFTTAEEAARARDEAAKKIHGEFAVLNFN